MKILSHYPPVPPSIKSCDTKSFPETFLTKIKASKCPAKEKKTAQEKRKKTRGKRKVKSGDCCVTIKPKTSKFCYLCILKPGKLKFCFWKRQEGHKVLNL